MALVSSNILGRMWELPGRLRLTGFHASVGSASRAVTRPGERIRRVMKRTPRGIQLAQHVLGGELGVEHHQGGISP
jgi:hypothetical protein